MKTTNLLFCVLLLLSSCTKEKNTIPNIHGAWIRTDVPSPSGSDTLFFYDNGQAIIKGVEFLYNLESDSIHFSYNGNLFILCPTSTHHFSISNSPSLLSIENLSKLCLVETDRGISIYRKLYE